MKFDEGTYADITIAVECAVKKDQLPYLIDDLKAWLILAGESVLIFSFQNDRKYKAQVVNSIDFKQVFNYTAKFTIIFNCQPFKYAVKNDLITITLAAATKGITITHPGTIPAKAVVKVYCGKNTNFGTLTIGNRQMVITFSNTESIVLDSELEEAYYQKDDELVNANTLVEGEFLLLEPGDNIVNFDGIAKIEVTPNFRWL